MNKINALRWNDGNISYDTLVGCFGIIIVRARLNEYQGELIYLIQDGSNYGFATTGYGTCSYCDALKGCENLEEAKALAKEIGGKIQWKTKAEMLTFLVTHDWEGDALGYYIEHDQGTFDDFMANALRKLGR